MENKRPLQDVPTEVLQAKLRRANGMMTALISEEILFRSIFFKPGTENENLPSVVNVRLSGNDAPKIQYTDQLPKSGVGFKAIYDESGVMPISAEYTHYLDVIIKPASQEEFFAEVEKAAKYFKAANIVEPTADGKKRIEDLQNLKYGDKLDRTQPHWAFLNKQE